jgi:hypothetical protein
LGSVVTSKGRALAFPNIYQHQVSSFQLADPTRPGYRKILALFLVDPVLNSRSPLPSTTTVPPQQAHWRGASASGDERSPSMLSWMEGAPHGSMSKEEAARIRIELMDERTAFVATTMPSTFQFLFRCASTSFAYQQTSAQFTAVRTDRSCVHMYPLAYLKAR